MHAKKGVEGTEAELVREMDRLWRPVEGPILSGGEMKTLVGAGPVLLAGRVRAASLETNVRGEIVNESVDEAPRGEIGSVAQLVTRIRVFLKRVGLQ